MAGSGGGSAGGSVRIAAQLHVHADGATVGAGAAQPSRRQQQSALPALDQVRNKEAVHYIQRIQLYPITLYCIYLIEARASVPP